MEKRKAIWLVPALIDGSGGHRTILHHANLMQEKGWDVSLFFEHKSGYANNIRKQIENSFGYRFVHVFVGWDNLPKADAYFATIWMSAFKINNLKSGMGFYFVQDYESYFYPVGDNYLKAEESYYLGLNHITIGRWLSHKLVGKGARSNYFDFTIDENVYFFDENIQREKKSVCFIHQPEKSRRCSNLGLEALSLVAYHRPDIDIIIYGSSRNSKVDFPHRNLGLISLSECAKLYNKASVGLCLSATNPSRIPFEMSACGLTVVELHKENNLYDFNENNFILCAPTAESIASSIIQQVDLSELKPLNNIKGVGYSDKQFLDLVNSISAGIEIVQNYNKYYTKDALYVNGKLKLPEGEFKIILSLREKIEKYTPVFLLNFLKKTLRQFI